MSEVHVVAIEAEGLSHPEPRRGQESDHSLEGGRTQRQADASGRRHQRSNVGV